MDRTGKVIVLNNADSEADSNSGWNISQLKSVNKCAPA